MLFTSPTFILAFLPLAVLGFFLIGRVSPAGAAAWLLSASLLFYSHWKPADTLLLLASIGINFGIGRRICNTASKAAARRWLLAGLVFDLGLLAYFKYAGFVVSNLNLLPHVRLPMPEVTLPIGISFYTFTQIAFLVDAWRRNARESKPVHYGLFVSYFPHLVAGPVLHHAQMMPQFANPSIYKPQGANLTAGLALLVIGLFKKVVLADGISPYADAVFKPADDGALPGPEEAWLAAVAYALQLYFDFSGYSDMAIGLSWMFNVRLPINFNSPYQARNISEFWRRWHISLSSFLRDYLYIAMGGNRHGALRRHFNLVTTMVLGGLWHGANWTFVAWGALHGAYLIAHHTFRATCGENLHSRLKAAPLWRAAAWALTLLAVLLAWVLFRAETFAGASNMFRGLGAVAQLGATPVLLWNAGLHVSTGAGWCMALGAMALWAPNSNAIGHRALSLFTSRPGLRAAAAGALLGALLLLTLLSGARSGASAFIYFNF